MTITHKHSPVIQEDGYYPFGMVASSSKFEARSWKSEAGRPLQNDFLYNGKELQEELGLDWTAFVKTSAVKYDYGARMPARP